MIKNRLTRYSGLIALIVALIIFVIFAVLANTVRDRDVLQRDLYVLSITKGFLQQLERLGPRNEQLREDIKEHINFIRNGGELVSPYGPRWTKPPTTDAHIIDVIVEVEQSLEREDHEYFETVYRRFVTASARAAQNEVDLTKKLQFGAAGIIVLGFLAVLGVLFFRLGRADAKTEKIISENNHILAAMDDGLFLIDQEFQIGQQKSAAVQNIFGMETPVEGDFFDFLGRFVNREDLQVSKEYLELLFAGRVKQKLMTDLNPLKEVVTAAIQKSGLVTKKYLDFSFARDDEDKENRRILVTISDVTKEVLLRRELETTKEMQKERMSMLLGLLHIEQAELDQFLDHSADTLNEINNILADENSNHRATLDKLDNIYRLAHRLKGDACALGVTLFERSIHRFEDSIEDVKKMPYLDGRNILGLTVQLKEMIAEIELVRSLVPQMNNIARIEFPDGIESNSQLEEVHRAKMSSGEINDSIEDVGGSYHQRLSTLAQRVAIREKKKIQLDCSSFDLFSGDAELAEIMYSVAVQLVRNSVVHGIELPTERVEKGKAEHGAISVLLSQVGDEKIQLVVRDDGVGLQFEKIRQRAVDQGLVSAEEASSLGSRQLLRFIFTSGFSSQKNANLDAGRGVGLDIVRSKIRELGGNISVKSSDQNHCQFSISIPTNQAVNQE